MHRNKILIFLLLILSTTLQAANNPAIIFDASTADGWEWSTHRNAGRLDREFVASNVLLVKDGDPTLLWSFTPKTVTYNDIWYACVINRKFARVRIVVENRGAAFGLSMRTADANSAEWTIKPIPLAEHSGVKEIVIPVTDFYVAGQPKDENGIHDFPLDNIVLIAGELKTNTAYSLAIRSLSFEYDPPPQIEASVLSIPASVDAGSPFDAAITAKLVRGTFSGNDASIELRASGVKGTKVSLTADAPVSDWHIGETRTLSTSRTPIGKFAYGGTFDAALKLDGFDVDVLRQETPIVPRVTVRERTRSTVIAEVRQHNGVPTFFINGVPRPALAFSSYNPSVAVFSNFNNAGVTFSCIMATPTDHAFGFAHTSWKSEKEFDFTQLDQRMDMVLASDSNAYVIPRIFLGAPRWWSVKHPNDVVTYASGDSTTKVFLLDGKPVPSWASDIWRKDTADAIRKLVAYVDASPYADRIIGYHIASGSSEEWMQWAANDRLWVDYSPANLKKFRAWLTSKYGTDTALKDAWRDNAVTLAGAQIPSKNERATCRLGTLRDPETEQPSIDYDLYTSDLIADTISYFCSVIKVATKQTKLAGVFYGYILELAGEQRQKSAGHLALRKVWDIPDLDFIACPTSYAFRSLGTGTPHMMSLIDGAMRAGKVWIDENDIRTSLSQGNPGYWGKPANVTGDIQQQERELGFVLSHGLGQWWFDVGFNKYNNPSLMQKIGQLTRYGTDFLSVDRSPVDEIAFVVDSRALAMMAENSLSRDLVISQIPQAQRIGAPIGWYDISDLQTLPPRKLYVFLNLFDPSEKDIVAINKLRSQGRVLVYMYAAGVYENGAFKPATAERLLGFPLAYDTNAMELAVTISTNTIIPKAKGLVYGNGDPVRGFFTPEQTSGTVLGLLKNGKPGLVLTASNDCTVIWSAGPALPTSLLRQFAEMAHVHCYTGPGDLIWATKEALAVTVEKDGKRTVTLLAPSTVYDVYAERMVAKNLSSFEINMAAAETKLFRITREK